MTDAIRGDNSIDYVPDFKAFKSMSEGGAVAELGMLSQNALTDVVCGY